MEENMGGSEAGDTAPGLRPGDGDDACIICRLTKS
jgi:hypothetical protein